MTQYRAIVSITFDDDDLEALADSLGIDVDRLNPMEAIRGELDNLGLGSGWIEQLYRNKRPQIAYLSTDALSVEISPHDED